MCFQIPEHFANMALVRLSDKITPQNRRYTIVHKTADLPWENVLKIAGSMAGIVCGVGWMVLLATPVNQKNKNGYKNIIHIDDFFSLENKKRCISLENT